MRSFRAHLLPVLCLVTASAVDAQQPSTSAGFVTLLGRDTVSIEHYTRSAGRIEGAIAIRNPRTRTVNYTATIDDAGFVRYFELTSRMAAAPATAPSVIERVSTMTDTVVVTEVRRNGTRDTVASGRDAVKMQGGVPWVQNGTAFYEQMVQQLQRASADSVEMPQILFRPNHIAPSYVRRHGRDSVEINFYGSLLGRVDRKGRILGLSGRATTVKTETVRVPSLDFDRIVNGWVEQERAGMAAGQISPRDTVRATLAGAELWVDYGRPAKRGRQIFGSTVPWDSVWRTGANAATQFRTSHDLKIAGVRIPAGLYTLWTLPTARGASLIVNKQTGQWGTQYDSAQDLVRVPLTVETLPARVDRFTIDIEPTARGGVLRLVWDDRRFSAPLEVEHE